MYTDQYADGRFESRGRSGRDPAVLSVPSRARMVCRRSVRRLHACRGSAVPRPLCRKFHHREVRAAFRIRLLGELAQASTGRRRNITMRALVSGTEGGLICRPAPTFFGGGLFSKGGLG